jgi:uncharacterized protein (TIGR02453 family)
MIQEKTLQFFRELNENNSKEWFDQNRKSYEAARKNFIDFINPIIDGISKFDEAMANAGLEAKKTMMRINRDVRFSKDKTPYNTHFFSSISKGGKSSPYAGYFVRISPNGSFYGAGIYRSDTATIDKVGQEIDYDQEEWTAIIENETIKNHFGELQSSEQLSRPPKGYAKDHPLIDWIKRKDHFVQKNVTDQEVLDIDFAKQIVKDLAVIKPMIVFINRALEGRRS